MNHFLSTAKWANIGQVHKADSGPQQALCKCWLEGWVTRKCQGTYTYMFFTYSESAFNRGS